ncbi:uncharacterized protein LOC123523447 [Mercenaria mercenaria]|uniref:uncharacterized protein LOC123523447 n=1 Tax=Mercenaria mercenaria TaxID=6596 RepID=UPI00234E97C5|nr:uncharacterized protein LOC123523447 [Mercenaria mercenaria]
MNVAFVVVLLLIWSESTEASFGGDGGSKSGRGNNGRKKRQTSVDVGVEATKNGGRASAGVSHKGNGWSAGVKGTIDSDGNWGARAGFSISFGKRSVHWNGRHYIVRVHADQCDFHVYDGNKDGTIVKNEIHAIFEDHTKAEELFDALDITTGDGRIEEDEFYFMSRVVIDGCDSMDKL